MPSSEGGSLRAGQIEADDLGEGGPDRGGPGSRCQLERTRRVDGAEFVNPQQKAGRRPPEEPRGRGFPAAETRDRGPLRQAENRRIEGLTLFLCNNSVSRENPS